MMMMAFFNARRDPAVAESLLLMLYAVGSLHLLF